MKLSHLLLSGLCFIALFFSGIGAADGNSAPAEGKQLLPALTLTKTADVEFMPPLNEKILYTIRIKNTGNSALKDLQVIDPLTGLNQMVASLELYGEKSFKQEFRVTQACIDTGKIINIATVTGKDDTGAEVMAEGTHTLLRTIGSRLKVTKSANMDTLPPAGETIQYTILTENVGDVPLKNVRITDPLTGLNQLVASLGVGAGKIITQSFRVTSACVEAGALSNTAWATGTDPSGQIVEAEDTVVLRGIPDSSLTVRLSADVTTIPPAGEEIRYETMVKNTGETVVSDIQVSNSLAGLNEFIEVLAPDEEKRFSMTHRVTSAEFVAAKIMNTAKATGKTPDGHAVSHEDTLVLWGTPLSALKVTKTAEVSELPAVGETIRYEIDVKNIGVTPLTEVEISDPLTGFRQVIASLATYATKTYHQSYQVRQADVDAGEVVNTAHARGKAPDGTFVSDGDTIILRRPAVSSLKLTKTTDTDALPSADEEIEYEITVENTGRVVLTDVDVQDPLVGLDEQFSTLAVGESRSFKKIYIVTAADEEAGFVENIATATARDPEGRLLQDEDGLILRPHPGTGLKLNKTAKVSTLPAVGEKIPYEIVIKNTGQTPLSDIVVTDSLIGLRQVIASLDLYASETLHISYPVRQRDVDAGEVRNTARAVGKGAEGSIVSSEDTAIVRGSWRAGLRLSKKANQSVLPDPGNTITYLIHVENTGLVSLNHVAISDPLIGLEEEVETLNAGQTFAFQGIYTVTAHDIAQGQVENQVTAVATAPDGQVLRAEDSVIVNARTHYGLALTKSAQVATLPPAGEFIPYKLIVENIGQVPLSNVRVRDPLTGLDQMISALELYGSRSFDLDYKVRQKDVTEGKVENIAWATVVTPTGNTVRSEDTVVIHKALQSGLRLTKTASPSLLPPAGEDITYALTVENIGQVELRDVAIVDPLIRFNKEIATLAVGESKAFSKTYRVTPADEAAGMVVNTAQATATDHTGQVVHDEDMAIVKEALRSGLKLTKTADVEVLPPVGESIHYEIIVKNTGNTPLTDLEITDPLTGLKKNFARLAVGSAVTVPQSHEVTQAHVDAGRLSNTAMAVARGSDGDMVADEDTLIIWGSNPSVMTVTKTADTVTLPLPDERILYTISLENTSEKPLSTIVISDPLTGFYESFYTLMPGEIRSYTSPYTVTKEDYMAGQVVNIVTATALDLDGKEVSDQDLVFIRQKEDIPGIMLTKKSNVITLPAAGYPVTFTLTVKNSGNVPLFDVIVEDPLLEVREVIPRLEIGAVKTLQDAYTVTEADVDAGMLENKAFVTGYAPDNTEVSDEDFALLWKADIPDLKVTKKADVSALPKAGEKVNYIITVKNPGDMNLTEVQIDDPQMNFHTVIPLLAAGAVRTHVLEYTVTQEDVDAGWVENTVTVTAVGHDGELLVDSDTEMIYATHRPAIRLKKKADHFVLSEAGEVVNYTLTVSNSGNVTLSSVELEDPLTGFQESISSLLPGESSAFTTSYTVTQVDIDRKSLENKGTVTARDPEGNLLYDEDTLRIGCNRRGDIKITKTANLAKLPAVGQEIIYTLTVENTGAVSLSDVNVEDPLTGFSETLSSLQPGEAKNFTSTYTVTQDDVDRASLVNTATVTSTDSEGTPFCDEDTITLWSDSMSAIALSKKADPVTLPLVGKDIHYDIEVRNTGNTVLTNVVVMDPLTGLESPALTLTPGETRHFRESYTVTQDDLDRGEVFNRAAATGTGSDGQQVSATAQQTVRGNYPGELFLKKETSLTTLPPPGETIPYTITVKNNGAVTVRNLEITDPLTGLTELFRSLSPGASRVFQTVYTVTEQDRDLGKVENTASATGKTPAGEEIKVSSQLVLNCDSQAGVSVHKSANLPHLPEAGKTVLYTITVANSGTTSLKEVLVLDPLTALRQTLPTLAAGATRSFQTAYKVTEADVKAGQVVNTVTVTAKDAAHGVLTASASVSLSKENSGDDPEDPDDPDPEDPDPEDPEDPDEPEDEGGCCRRNNSHWGKIAADLLLFLLFIAALILGYVFMQD